MKVLFVSNLFPNRLQPARGMFNAQQVQALSKLCSVVVIAPSTRAMPVEEAYGVRVLHPRFLHLPVVTRPLNGWLFARAIEPEIRKGGFDIALASWAYPDGYAVMLLAQKYGFSFAVDVLGSDVNCLFANSHRKYQILRTLRASNVVFAKSKALANLLGKEGIQSVIDYNGIDRDKFRPLDRIECCRKLGLDSDRRRILFVGNLVPVKGPTVLAKAFSVLSSQFSVPSGTDLVFIGNGPEHSKIEKISSQSKVQSPKSMVYLVGAKPHHEIPLWMNAGDVLCLPSLNEGLPNVALEAMACGLPVVASSVGGVPEVVRENVNGLLVPPSDAVALATALRVALTRTWNKTAIVQSVVRFDWDENAKTVLAVLQKHISSRS